ncbi:josephin domain-containing protein [Sporobolomyces koalae]|uniref:josephin domain-containing protein n=1 Tax=Sporobolomyces koalae TaxID=500713 RepID=UPI00316DD596
MSDLVGYIYHEKQEPGSMMCLQHSINNLLQSELFSPASLADIATELDMLESAQLDPGTRLRGEYESQNVDESGFFSVQVAEKALEVVGLRLVRWGSQELAHYHDKPEQIEAYVLNQHQHWFSLRRFASNRFYNLDSCIPEPSWISETYLGLQLREFEMRGYSIFAVVPSSEGHLDSLPPCSASAIGPTLPPPSGNGGTDLASASGSHIRFNGTGRSLASNGSASTSTSLDPFASRSNPSFQRTYSHGKRPAVEADDEEDDDIIIEDGVQGTSSATSNRSSVEGEGEQRKRRRKLDHEANESATSATDHLSEEDMMARAIEESLRVSRLSEGAAGGANGGETTRFADGGEDEELQRALQASLAGPKHDSPSIDDDEEEDAPTMEQLRAKRLARFG